MGFLFESMSIETPKTISRNVLSHAKFLKLAIWLKEAHKVHAWTSYAEVCTYASKTLGFDLSTHSIKSAYEVLDIELVKPTINATTKRDRTQIVAAELSALLRELGKEPSTALMSVIHRKGA